MKDVDPKSFIEELRSLSVPAKRKVMISVTIATMLVVVYFWVAYFNSIVPNVSPTTQVSATAEESDTNGPGVLGLLANAAGSLWQAIGNGVQGVTGAVRNPKQYNISPQ